MRLTRREFSVGAAAAFAALGGTRMAAAQQSLVVPTYGGLWAKFWEAQLLPGFSTAIPMM